MKLAFNGATTMRASLATDISAASSAGFEFVEIWSAKLYDFLNKKTAADLKTLFTKHGIRPYSINSIEHITFRTDAEYAEIKRECELLSCIAAEIECPYLVVVPGKMPADANHDVVIRESVCVLRDLGQIASRHNVGVAFEFLGEADCSVRTLSVCNEIIEETNRANVGFVIDTFHFYKGGSNFESIAQIDPRKLFIFHINGAENIPIDELTDANRLYPGEGILPIGEMKARLDAIGFDGIVSVEIFRPEYWDDDPFEVAKKAKSAAENVLGQPAA